MKLDRILVQNILGLRHADLALTAPITLVAGPNGAGKSSLGDAISMALLGKPKRVSLKKDIGQLVTDGAKKGLAAVWADGEPLGELVLPSDTHAVNPQDGWQYLPFVLDAAAFTTAPADERRKLLFQLTGCRATPDAIEVRLIELGADPAKVATIKPLLLSGFPGASKEAKSRATEAKGAWRGVTGETYGDKKAEGWEPALPTTQVDEQELAESRKALQAIETDLEEAQQTLGAHKATRSNHAALATRIAELEELAGLVQRRQNKLDHDQADLQHWKSQLAAAEGAGAGGKQGLVHDMARNLAEWQALAKRTDGVKEKNGPTTPWLVLGEMDRLHLLMDRYLEEHGPLGSESSDPDQAKRVPEFRQYVDNLTRTVANSQRDLAAAESAAAQAAELKAQLEAAPSEDAIANAEQLINELRQQRDTLRAKVEALQAASQAIAQRDSCIQQAAKHHADVQAWTLIGDALAPEGIPAEMLAKALSPINATLHALSSRAGWPEVSVSSDMEVTANGRAYVLLSESEQWRCNTLIGLAIAQASGLRLAVLDRFDVLDLPSRAQLLGLLIQMAKAGEIDSVIVSGTLKAKPAALPTEINAVWIERGTVESNPVSAAA